MTLRGSYTWKHAVELMNISTKIRKVSLCCAMQLEVQDFDVFFEAVVQWLQKKDTVNVPFTLVMDPLAYQKYIYVHCHVKSVLAEWNQSKPYFEAKLSTKTSPTVKQLLDLSLIRFKTRIVNARSNLFGILDQVVVECTILQLGSLQNDLLSKPNMGNQLARIATSIMGDIDVLREKFKGTETIRFKKLPYEFQSRLVDLLPLSDLIAFKFAGKTTANQVHRRGMFSSSVCVVRNGVNYENVKEAYGNNIRYDIVSKSRFFNSDNHYVQNALCLNLDSTEKYDRAVNIICGNYTYICLQGPFTWKHVIRLIHKTEKLHTVYLFSGMQLEVAEFDHFFEAVAKWLDHQKHFVIARTPACRQCKKAQFCMTPVARACAVYCPKPPMQSRRAL
uniref:F-box domain-containing protein n=1 Tax=Panagrellus redivivus TaxID=6233 RepID=A0A7E4VNJ2_PANRE